jgi:hypothetical protein
VLLARKRHSYIASFYKSGNPATARGDSTPTHSSQLDLNWVLLNPPPRAGYAEKQSC